MAQLWLFCSDYGELQKIDKPKEQMTDNDILWNYQVDWLTSKSEKAHSMMWMQSITICKKMIRKEMKQKKFYLSREDIEDKAYEAVEYVFRQYDRHFSFIIKKFVGALYFGVTHSLYYQTLGERCFSDAVKLMNNTKGMTIEEAFLKAKEKIDSEQRKKKKVQVQKTLQLELFDV